MGSCRRAAVTPRDSTRCSWSLLAAPVCRLSATWIVETVLFEAVTQRVPTEAQQLRGSGHVAAGAAQRLPNQLAFELVESDPFGRKRHCVVVSAPCAAVTSDLRRQVFWTDLLRVFQDQCTFEHVAQFANVPRP